MLDSDLDLCEVLMDDKYADHGQTTPKGIPCISETASNRLHFPSPRRKVYSKQQSALEGGATLSKISEATTNMTNDREPGSCLIVSGADEHPERKVKLTKFIEVLNVVFNELVVVSGTFPNQLREGICHIQVTHPISDRENQGLRILNFLLLQIILVYHVVLKVEKCGTIIMFRGYPAPAIVGRLLGKRVIRFHGGPSSDERGFNRYEQFVLESVPNTFANDIIVPAQACVDHFALNDFEEKIHISSFHVDNEMVKDTAVDSRPFAVGYLGELSEEKGFDRLIEGIEHLNRRNDEDVELLVGGQGPLLKETNHEFVTYRGWIDHANVPEFFNSIRLFVLPSKSEGLPTVVLESMGCGTPVLASSVGGIPEVIDDGENGFLLSDNTPEVIAMEIGSVLENHNLSTVSDRAVSTISKTYSLSAVAERYRKIMTNQV